MFTRIVTVGLVLGWVATGCGDKREAHLERFMDSVQVQPDYKIDTIDPFAVPSDPAVADRINTMTFSEVSKRLGAHRFRAKTRFEFQSPETRAWLREDDLIVLAQNGDFRAKVENDGGQGYELVFSDGKFYSKNRFGPFHQRDTMTGDHLKWRDAAYGSWAAAYRLFRGRLSFTKQELTRYHGRDALRFSISLSRDEPRLAGTPEPVVVPEGVDKYVYPVTPTASVQHRWRDQAQPRKVSGTLLVDADVAVILKANLTGTLSVPSPQPITLSVSARLEADGFGNPPSIPSPGKDEIKPVPSRIQVDTRPLDFYFGKGFTSSLGAPAGVAKSKDETRKKSDTGGQASKP